MEGINLEKLMATKPEDLAKVQIEALKKHAISVLDNVKKLIEDEKFKELKSILVYSPAGDYMGTDTYHINFSYEVKTDGYHPSMDLYDLTEILENLKKLCESGGDE